MSLQLITSLLIKHWWPVLEGPCSLEIFTPVYPLTFPLYTLKVALKLWCASESIAGLVNIQVSGSHPQTFWFSRSGWGPSTYLSSSLLDGAEEGIPLWEPLHYYDLAIHSFFLCVLCFSKKNLHSRFFSFSHSTCWHSAHSPGPILLLTFSWPVIYQGISESLSQPSPLWPHDPSYHLPSPTLLQLPLNWSPCFFFSVLRGIYFKRLLLVSSKL